MPGSVYLWWALTMMYATYTFSQRYSAILISPRLAVGWLAYINLISQDQVCILATAVLHIPFLEVHDQLLSALLYQLLSVVSLSLHHLQLAVLLAVQALQLLALLRRAAGH